MARIQSRLARVALWHAIPCGRWATLIRTRNNRAEDKWARISEGDIDYADVRKALKEINFYGWCAAEVGGGDAAELKRISEEMDLVFGLV